MGAIRILVCLDCRTTEVLPEYRGDPQYDSELTYAADKHKDATGEPHRGRLYPIQGIDMDGWNASSDKRDEILKRIWQEHGHTGLEPWVYAAKETLKADAMQCFEQHLRPENCADFHSSKKVLVPPTASERREVGAQKWDKNNPHLQRYLCDYCPMRSVAQTKVWNKLGLYK